MIEVEVHSLLRSFLRERDRLNWPHHLTMARLVARAFRLGRSALIQTGSGVEKYCLSYLTPALLWEESVIIVVPQSIQNYLLETEIPQLQNSLETKKKIIKDDRLLKESNSGIILISPETWLRDRLEKRERFPKDILTIIDGADDLERWTRETLSADLDLADWEDLRQIAVSFEEWIRNLRVQLTKAIFSRPKNPYECYLIEDPERKTLFNLFQTLSAKKLLSPKINKFWHRWQKEGEIIWASVKRERGEFTLHIAPGSVATDLKEVWNQPIVIIGSFLDWEANASVYRQQLGLEDLLCLKFSPSRQSEEIQLYLPDRLPMPNTPQFQSVSIEQMRTLVSFSTNVRKPVILLVEDVPLKAQVGAAMAAEFGSRVRVEKTDLAENGILVSGWEFWRSHQDKFPVPQLLAIATLPLPSLENPLIAGRVAYYKKQRQDWFRLYLLPTALREIQRAVLPLRESQGVVALLDNRVNHRSYGKKILAALEPCARINYIDPSWFGFSF